jgi:ankyrin repeat protein
LLLNGWGNEEQMLKRILWSAVGLMLLCLAVGGWHFLCFGRLQGETALMAWSEEGWTPAVRLLLALGADPNARSYAPGDGDTPLYYAAASGRASVVKLLLTAGAEPNTVDSKGFTPLGGVLYYANGDRDTVSLLLDAGARVDFPDRDHSVLGGFLPSNPRRVEILKQLLAHGGSVNDRYAPGKPHFVSWGRCCPDMLEVLLDNGADVNMRTDEGRTALMQAAAYGSVKTVRFLLTRGADRNLQDNEGRTALDLAQAGLAATDIRTISMLGWHPKDSNRVPSYEAAIELLTPHVGDAPM